MDRLDRPFTNVMRSQCPELLTCAGNVVANVFSSGGRAATLRVGNWKPCSDPTIPDIWCEGYDLETDSVTLECLPDVNPVAGHEEAGINPFVHALWPPNKGARAISINDALEKSRDSLPEITGPLVDHRPVFSLRSSDAFYQIPKAVSSAFGAVLARGLSGMGVELYRGPGVVEKTPKTVIEHSGKAVEQINPDGSKVMVPVQRSRNIVVSETIYPVYLVINLLVRISLDDVINAVRVGESTYSPEWTLGGIFSGKYAKGAGS